ncbi:unnamed protein product [Closterium sp. NIES-54]
MVGVAGEAEVVDTLEARLEVARRRHEAYEYRSNLPLAVIEAGIRSVWVEEHPARLASPRPVNNEGGVAVGVNASGDQVSSSAGGMSRQRGVIHANEVGGVQTRGMWSLTAASSSKGDVGGQRSSMSPMPPTHMTAGRIAPSYGYLKFTPDRISVTPLLIGRPDILTWKEAIEPQLEMAGQIGFARGTVAIPEEHFLDLRADFRASYGSGSSGWKPIKDADKKKSAKDSGRGGGSRHRQCWLCGDPNHLSFKCPDRTDSDANDAKGGRGRSSSRRPRQGRNQPCKEKQSTKSWNSAKDADSSTGGKGRDDKEASCSLVGVVEPTVSLAPEAAEDFHAMAAAVQANPA